MIQIQDLKSRPGLLVALAAMVLPFTVPLVFLLFPVLALGALYWLSSYNAASNSLEIEANAIPRGAASENEQPISIAAKASTQPKPSAKSQDQGAAPTTAVKPSTRDTSSSKPATATATGPKAVGGAAILAKLKAQKAARAAAEAAAKDAQAKQKGLTVLYASQLGTAAEIAKNIHAEAEAKGIKSHLAAMNDFGFANISAENTPLVVIVASSTGDGDAPDNSAKFYNEVKRRSNAENRLQGVSFTVLGLGDSNYTRYMAVPRVFKNRFLEMGATTFYDPIEADEVDGLEEIVDEWISKLWVAVAGAVETKRSDGGEGNTAAAMGGEKEEDRSNKIKKPIEAGDELQGVPALPKLRISLNWADDATAAAVRTAETAGPTPDQLSYRDPTVATGSNATSDEFNGLYSPDQPYWATITDAKLLTATFAPSLTSQTNNPDLHRRVLHLEFDISGSGMEQYYKPGDSIGIVPENNPDMVEQIIKILEVDPTAVFSVSSASASRDGASGGDTGEIGETGEKLLTHLKWPCTVRNAFLHGCDLTTAPRKSLLRLLAEHCSTATEKQQLLFLCSRLGRDAYGTEILAARPTLLDLLTMFPSCKPPLDVLLDALPALPPRMYSITCSPTSCPDKIQVAFTVVKYTTTTTGFSSSGTSGTDNKSIERQGVATTWLDRLCTPLFQLEADSTPAASKKEQVEGELKSSARLMPRVPIFLRKGGAFKPPPDLSTPWILIGPGTGVAPFRGFLQERRARINEMQKQQSTSTDTNGIAGIGECWLYFGCRRPDLDYLYESDLKSFEQDGTLTRLAVAFSRALPPSQQENGEVENNGGGENKKVYVQHLMAQHSAELYDLFINKKGTVFVCGDGATMAKDVHATLINIIVTGGKVAEAEAAVQLTALAKQGRYVRDIWS
jgi:sulfite reductase alpha subunit-like flavoprotein